MPSEVERVGFGTAVARRVFSLFLACALVPVGTLGFFAWVRSSQELESAARVQLRRDSKREGTAILSRLLVAEALLGSWGRAADARVGAGVAASRPFRSVSEWSANDVPGGVLTASEAAALQRGETALRTLPNSQLLLLRAVASIDGARRVLGGEIEPEYLWTFERDSADASLSVADGRGTLLFSSLPDASARAVIAASKAARATGGATIGAGERDEIAEPWTLFTAGHFASGNLLIVRGEPRATTLVPLAQFRRVFGWSALLALFVVAALSAIQIRRTLDPVRRLARAAMRFGDGDLSARAEITERGEFGELGHAFDTMAARVQGSVQSLRSASELGRALGSEPTEAKLIALLLKATIDAMRAQSSAFLRPGAGGAILVEGSVGSWEGVTPIASEVFQSGREAHREGTRAEFAFPVLDHHGQVAAVLHVSGPHADDGRPLAHFPERDLAVARSLASQASIALSNRALVQEFRSLFEGLIGLTIDALDAKSPYTAGHCRRVPIVSEMLADAVCQTRDGAFADFTFTPEQRYELRISALLHDFGKIVTPVHVMDKATKLEAIHDRIELIATRYAVLDRDAEIAELRSKLADAGAPAGAWGGLPELAEELAFLRLHNRGTEVLHPGVRERIGEIASRRWRTFEGVSLPVLSDDEAENLKIARGTLTDAERRVIEQHADYTIRLLAQLPFPPHLRGVPHIAGSHHERVCGGGYPLGLHGEQITLQGRLLGIADVFEALTAPDRPYRDPMTVSAAVGELRDMVKRGFLDSDVFDVFVREGVHLRYAREQLRPEQFDDETLDALSRIPGGPLPLG